MPHDIFVRCRNCISLFNADTVILYFPVTQQLTNYQNTLTPRETVTFDTLRQALNEATPDRLQKLHDT